MSWLFGSSSNRPPQSPPPPPQGTPGTPTGGSGIPPSSPPPGKMSAYQFDSSALERAAKAAKDLESSRYATDALDLARKQETTKQLELQKSIKEYEMAMSTAQIEAKRVEQEHRKAMLAEEAKQARAKAQYEDQLSRKRFDDQLSQQRASNDENLRRQEQSVAKQEAIRRESLAKEMDVRAAADARRIEAEIRGHAEVERKNRDIRLEQLKVKATEQRVTTLQAIQTAGDVFGSGFRSFLSDPERITATAAGVTMLAVGIYAAKHGIGVTSRVVESRLGKPSLVRETSRLNLIDSLRFPIRTIKQWYQRRNSTPTDALKGVVLEPSLEERLRDIAISTKNTRRNGGYYRNVLLYGPPGTGKTLFAKRLAAHSGLDYALMSGGDVAPMGRDGVTAIHKLFNWSRSSRRGLLLFVDEADAFLRKRASEHLSEELRSALNAFLYRTGEQSDRFMLVLASNTPEQFDWAINDRLDELIGFPLPTMAERDRIVRLYFDRFIVQPSELHRSRLSLALFDYDQACHEVAQRTEGLSGRELAKLAVAWQASAYASESGQLTRDMMMARVGDAVQQNHKKMQWQADEERAKRGIDAGQNKISEDIEASTNAEQDDSKIQKVKLT